MVAIKYEFFRCHTACVRSQFSSEHVNVWYYLLDAVNFNPFCQFKLGIQRVDF